MKKFSIVLLALLLAGGFAFAAELALDGEASSSLELDLENGTYGMVYGPDQDLSLTFSASATSEGEGDMYGVISITDAELAFASDDYATDAFTDPDDATNEIVAVTNTGWSFDLGDLEAKIVGSNWEVIFGSPTGLGNATAPDMDQDPDTDSYDGVDPALTRGEGLTINYEDITVGVDFMYTNATSTLEYLAYVAYGTELADGVNADVALAVNDDNFAGTVAASAEVEGVAIDAAFDMEFLSASSTFNYDASVATSYTMEGVTLDLAGYFDGTSFDAFAKASYAEDALTAAVWGYVSDNANAARGDAGDAWEVGADLSYQIDDVYKAYAEGGYTASSTVPFKVGVEAALIDNATLDLNYDTTNLGTDLGVVTASATVSF